MAAALLAVLLVQFVGGEIIFARMDTARMERAQAQRLADWLIFADKLSESQGDAVPRMAALWQPQLIVARSDTPPPTRAGEATDHRAGDRITAARPELAPLAFQAMREGSDLIGSMRLSGGGWLAFRASDYFEAPSQLSHYIASILLLLLCVLLTALLFGRMIAGPLAKIAAAAERVGREDDIAIVAGGPREVRQVAAAFDRMQARLLSRVAEREQSLAGISHDLRTPLARLRLNASTVEDEETRASLQADIREMETFVASVLDYLRGDEAEEQQRADIASILMTLVDEARDRGEAVDYAGPNRLEMVTRPVKLKRLVRNVVQNAARYAGNARVGLQSEADVVIVTIDDDGPGIPEHRMQAAFQPFSRIDLDGERRGGGVGLGLTIAKRLAERMGGSIMLYNREGGGLSVKIRLPMRN